MLNTKEIEINVHFSGLKRIVCRHYVICYFMMIGVLLLLTDSFANLRFELNGDNKLSVKLADVRGC
jgi:hypothetical protein